MESRQSRLDAAIALFRSEASASGYVVEEVRLRLPVPDVDVLPRVIIAQNSAGAGTPPPFPRTKQHRGMTSYPYGNGHDRVAIPRGEHAFQTTSAGVAYAVPPRPVSTAVNSYANGKGESNSGVKRTVSGSVIFHPIQPKTGPSLQGNNQVRPNSSYPDKKGVPSGSVTKATGDAVENQSSNGNENGPVNGKFWKTVIGGDKGRAILKAAESMQKMRYGVFVSKSTEEPKEEKGNTGQAMTSVKEEGQENAERCPSPAKKRKSEASAAEHGGDTGETTLHINGHSIPESHVQLLLSSAADISAREEERKRSSGSSSDHISIPTEERRARNTIPRPSGSRSRQTSSNGKQASSKNRKEGSERSASRSSTARPFKCSRCPSSFDRDGHLRVHILAVHEKKRPFVCQVCDASFGHSSSLLRHVRTVHQASPAIGSGKSGSRGGQRNSDSRSGRSDDVDEENIDDSEKHFRCSVCAQAFDRVALLNRHVANKHPLKSD
ncbi:Zinc finger C2H2-type domain containing protein [Gracilaria domingensis]|nr:Zinc finger C2H2-type domain containing protein [Gracilaria domingensis]